TGIRFVIWFGRKARASWGAGNRGRFRCHPWRGASVPRTVSGGLPVPHCCPTEHTACANTADRDAFRGHEERKYYGSNECSSGFGVEATRALRRKLRERLRERDQTNSREHLWCLQETRVSACPAGIRRPLSNRERSLLKRPRTCR
ncbi:unnamed protein product, partial [Ectocarpus sp. 12 AP-2014]